MQSYWSVVQTESRREHVAARFLEEDFEIYFPRIAAPHASDRERVAPLFPGYLFVEIIDQWWSVRWTVGVVRLLMLDDRPAKLPDGMVEILRKREIDGLVQLPKPKPVRPLAKGDPVKITAGLFKGKNGIFQGLSGAQRSRILLSWLGREVKALVPMCDVARLDLNQTNHEPNLTPA